MTNLQFRVLYREFLFRIVDLDVLAPQGDVTKLLGQFAALLAVVGLWVLLPAVMVASGVSNLELGLIFTWIAEHFIIATAMLVVGLFAVMSWESMFPDRRDVLVLAPLPIRGRTLFWAKIAAVATALSLTVLVLNFLPGLAAPFALAIAPTFSSNYDPAMPPVTAADMQSVLDRDMKPARLQGGALAPGNYVGTTVGVIEHGVRRVFSYGIAQPDSIFEIGSITKTFTGLVLAQMVAQGKTRFDEPVRDLLPAGIVAKPRGDEITLLDLVTHHSGLPRMPDNFNPIDWNNPYADYHADNLYAYVSKHGVAKPADATFEYSNLGVGLLGQALANRAGMSYPDLLEQEVTGPLGMSDTAVSLSPEQRSRFIQGNDGRNHPAPAWDLDALAGAGAIRSTADDMLTYLDAQLHPEKAGGLSAAIQESHQLRAESSLNTWIALAWFYNLDTGNFEHSGATGGYTSYVTFNLKGDYATVVLLNTQSVTGFADQLGQHIRQRLAGQPAISLANPVAGGSDRLWNRLRSFAAYWVAMFAAGAFIFCSVLSVQGLAQLLPRQQYLRVSSVLQMAFFCLLLTVYFLQPPFTSLETLAANQRWLPWIPSAWFFALFLQLNGPMPEQFAFLVHRAWMGLAIAGVGAAAAYLICYYRTLRLIVEQPDIAPASSGVNWLPRFGNSLETAVGQFSVRTLFRSRQHRVILAFYLGIGLAITIFFMRTPEARQLSLITGGDSWRQVSVPLLASSIMMMGAWVVGIRMVFSMPLDLRANWVFRITPLGGGAKCLTARRRALYALSVVPFWAGSVVLFVSLWPWRAAVGHLVVLGLVGVILAELCLHGTQKIPFTCSYLPGKSSFHLKLWLSVGLLAFLILEAADWERRALGNLFGYAVMAGILAIAAALAWRRTAALANSEEVELQFEEEPEPAILVLNIHKDGVMPISG
ncbi:MAG TPA: serine hydrolase domain-containing protein [Bryobacteraceae bacterium]|jgi:CubicO group peptidase (beta-lactamase class C family)|nr:serine hydrolase domain-containing protein [Bryobacteraceae bacterium]